MNKTSHQVISAAQEKYPKAVVLIREEGNKNFRRYHLRAIESFGAPGRLYLVGRKEPLAVAGMDMNIRSARAFYGGKAIWWAGQPDNDWWDAHEIFCEAIAKEERGELRRAYGALLIAAGSLFVAALALGFALAK